MAVIAVVGEGMVGTPGISARVFAFVILLAPAPLLFHRPFMLGVMVPFMRALGAL